LWDVSCNNALKYGFGTLAPSVNVKDKVDINMARRCDICGKGTVAGNSVTRKGQAKKKGGVGQHIGVTTKRVFRPNIVSVKTLINGTPRTIKICTRCLRSGRVQKVV
jgi:large subunit ribosomal protein L28